MQRELLFLREMIDAATRIRDVIGDLDVETLRADGLRRDTVLWNFTVLGEAANQVPTAVKDAHPEFAWAAPVRMRNRIIHGYWDIDLRILHEAAADDLPTLIGQLTAVLAELEQSSKD